MRKGTGNTGQNKNRSLNEHGLGVLEWLRPGEYDRVQTLLEDLRQFDIKHLRTDCRGSTGSRRSASRKKPRRRRATFSRFQQLNGWQLRTTIPQGLQQPLRWPQPQHDAACTSAFTRKHTTVSQGALHANA